MRSENKQLLVNDLHGKEPRGEEVIFLKSAFSGEIRANDQHWYKERCQDDGGVCLSARDRDAAVTALGTAVWGQRQG